MNKEVEKILIKFDGFTDGVRILMLIHRKKDGGSQKDGKAMKRTSKNADEFEEILSEMIDIKNKSEDQLRIYSSVNKRDINKAIRTFKQRQLDSDYQDTDTKEGFYFDIKNRWISSLMQYQSRAETNFLIDVDDKSELEELKKYIFKLVGRNVKYFETKNGYHIVTPPFNPNDLVGVEIKKDGLLLLSY